MQIYVFSSDNCCAPDVKQKYWGFPRLEECLNLDLWDKIEQKHIHTHTNSPSLPPWT